MSWVFSPLTSSTCGGSFEGEENIHFLVYPALEDYDTYKFSHDVC